MSERRTGEAVVRPLLRALDYMHGLGIAHRCAHGRGWVGGAGGPVRPGGP
jgi:hypothetical protein